MDAKAIHLLVELHARLAKARQPFRLVVRRNSLLVRLLEITSVPISRDGSLEEALREIKASLSGEPLRAPSRVGQYEERSVTRGKPPVEPALHALDGHRQARTLAATTSSR